eukprot:4441114-Alexandrium_andersonii.AAC.1
MGRLKNTVITHMRNHEEDYVQFFSGNAPSAHEEKCDTYERYLELLSKNAAWGSDLEAMATA